MERSEPSPPTSKQEDKKEKVMETEMMKVIEEIEDIKVGEKRRGIRKRRPEISGRIPDIRGR